MSVRDRYRWQTTVAQARLEGLAGAGLAYTVRLRGSAHRLTHRYGMSDPAAPAAGLPHEGNRVTEVALEVAAEQALGASWQVAGGAEAARTASALDMRGPLMRPIAARAATARATAWGEARRRLGPGAAVEAGCG
jgi:hypothetical protein